MSGSYVLRIVIVSLLSYVSITSFAVLIATLTRQIGGAIPIVIIGILFFYFAGTIIALMDELESMQGVVTAMRIVNPLYALSEQSFLTNESTHESTQIMRDDTFISAIINNLVYTVLFFVLGWTVFKKRDVK